MRVEKRPFFHSCLRALATTAGSDDDAVAHGAARQVDGRGLHDRVRRRTCGPASARPPASRSRRCRGRRASGLTCPPCTRLPLLVLAGAVPPWSDYRPDPSRIGRSRGRKDSRWAETGDMALPTAPAEHVDAPSRPDAAAARHPAHRGRERGLGRAHPGRRAAAHPGVRRPVAPRPARAHPGGHRAHRARRTADRRGPGDLPRRPRVRLRAERAGRRPLPRQRLPLARLGRDGAAARQGGHPDLRAARPAQGGARARAPPERPRPRLRPDRVGQDHDAGRHDRRDQRRAPLPHPHHRGPDRVPAPQQGRRRSASASSTPTPRSSAGRCGRPCARTPTSSSSARSATP